MSSKNPSPLFLAVLFVLLIIVVLSCELCEWERFCFFQPCTNRKRRAIGSGFWRRFGPNYKRSIFCIYPSSYHPSSHQFAHFLPPPKPFSFSSFVFFPSSFFCSIQRMDPFGHVFFTGLAVVTVCSVFLSLLSLCCISACISLYIACLLFFLVWCEGNAFLGLPLRLFFGVRRAEPWRERWREKRRVKRVGPTSLSGTLGLTPFFFFFHFLISKFPSFSVTWDLRCVSPSLLPLSVDPL